MLTAPLASTVAYLLLASAVAVWAGHHLRTRHVGPDARFAAGCLRAFWTGLGLLAFVQACLFMFAAWAVGSGPLLTALVLANMAMNGLALGALVAYFAYLLTGRRAAAHAAAALYVAVTAWAVVVILQAAPLTLTPTKWAATLDYASPPSDLAALALNLAFLLPALVGSLLFVAVGLRAPRGATRSRGVLVGVSLAVWFGTTIALAATGSGTSDLAHFAVLAAAAVGLAGVYVAYRPPAWARRAWGLEPLEGTGAAGKGTAQPPPARMAFEERVRQLI